MVSKVIAYLYPAAVSLLDYRVQDDGAGAYIAYWNESLGPQPTTQELADTEASPEFAAWLDEHGGDAALTSRRLALDAVRSQFREQHLVDRAIAETARDEINLLRAWITSFKAAAAAATSLANFQSRIAALDNLPQRTASQMKTSLENKISDGSAD